MLYRYEDYYDATDGDNLTLTLDSTIQPMPSRPLRPGSRRTMCATAASAW